MNVFDKLTKLLQKNRAAMAPDAATYDYIRDEVCWSIMSIDMRRNVTSHEMRCVLG